MGRDRSRVLVTVSACLLLYLPSPTVWKSGQACAVQPDPLRLPTGWQVVDSTVLCCWNSLRLRHGERQQERYGSISKQTGLRHKDVG